MSDVGVARRTRPQRVVYFIVKWVVTAFARTYWRATFSGTENIPKSGGFIVAPTHRSNIDPIPLISMTHRRMSFLGKDSLWKHPVTAKFFDLMGGYPVSRGTADREALRRSIEVVSRGEGMVVFPEGARQSGPLVQELFDGCAYIAARGNVPILPIGIGGSERAMRKGKKMIYPVKIHYEIGALIPAPVGEDGGRASRDQLRETTEQLHADLQKLFDTARVRAGDA